MRCMEKELKYNPSDYPDISDYIEEIEKKYNEYLKKNKDDISEIFLADAINNLRNGLKSSIGLKNITKEKAEEMLDYYWGLLDD